ncbi:BTAD domain-containing putative transcriptional regulator [Streptomyces rubrogriseus]|uniref:AfsR/SARP family transcriptional regulator n=1 Tax=Streptomyces rubrogriseus TaxID=194673 RepID=UPI0036F8D615
MLGPLEVLSGEQSLPLGGVKQRATLGYLLLQANQVVPTSQLLSALWSTDNAPATARKILQNAVWGLRGMLSEHGSAAGAAGELVTRAPGYMIRVDPDRVDLHLFRRRVSEGRARLSAGVHHEAVRLLGEALDLWRGPVLADLVETGTMWPELTAVQNSRLDVLEDYLEAKLRCGEHYAVLGELETTVEAEPLRERSSGLLMLALYRCGRQVDALSVYNRIRATLVEDLGLEPGHELRRLQQAILAQDQALDQASALLGTAVPATTAVPAATAARPAPAVAPPGHREVPAQFRGHEDRRPALAAVASPTRRTQSAERQVAVVQWPAQPRGAPVRGGTAVRTAPVAERPHLSVLLVQNRLTPGHNGFRPEAMDEDFEHLNAVTRQQIERLGGEPVATIGAVTLGLFRPCSAAADDGTRRGEEPAAALRAVRAAAAIRDRLAVPVPPHGRPASPGLTFHASVATGRVLVRSQPGDGTAPTVNGALLDLCQALLAETEPGEIRVCAATRAATVSVVAYGLADGSPSGWRALNPPAEDSPAGDGAI